MKKLIVCALAILLIGSLACSALAASVVLSGDANVRADPNLNGYKLGSLPRGYRLPYMFYYSTDNRGVVWYCVSYDDREAWISSKYCYIDYEDDYDKNDRGDIYVYVYGDSNVRSVADLDGDVLTVAREGSVLSFEGEMREDSRGVMWYFVYCNGYYGWISSMYTGLKY